MQNDQLNERLQFYGFDRLNSAAFGGVGRALKRRLEHALAEFYRKI